MELREVFNEPIDCYSLLRDGGTATYRLIVRRIRDMYNSTGRFVATIRERLPHNSAYLNPQDLMALQLRGGRSHRNYFGSWKHCCHSC